MSHIKKRIKIDFQIRSGMKNSVMATNEFKKSTATIAAWNLATFEALSDERIERQAKGLHLLDAELVSLVEVKNENHLSEMVRHLGDDGVDYEYTLVPQDSPDPPRKPMHIAIIYKRGVEVTNPFLLDRSDLDNNNLRKAFVCDVKISKLDFKLIGVHLKSGRNKEDQDTRDEQCKIIGDYIKEVRGPEDRDPDILLMGDFNMIPGQDTSNFFHLGADDIMDFVSNWDLQDRYSHILKSGRENLLDGFAVSKKRSKEYIRGSLRLFPMHWAMDMGQAKFREKVSDHLPFCAQFQSHSNRQD